MVNIGQKSLPTILGLTRIAKYDIFHILNIFDSKDCVSKMFKIQTIKKSSDQLFYKKKI